ncbi:MAG TPA: NAD-dependent epimerase/dehydratase family protein [Ktedonobacterales bacterium]|jgi:UDP-glucuronate 4-epimerase
MGVVLVTGGAGFIGSHLCDRLSADGKNVIGVDTFDDQYDPARKRQNIKHALTSPRFHLEECSITDRGALAELFSRYPIAQVVHLAARTEAVSSLAEPMHYEQVNVQSMVYLLELCRLHGVERFIFGSSWAVYGAQGRYPFREDHTVLHPSSPFAATKRAGELQCLTYHQMYGLPVTCLRFFSVYGPRQRSNLAVHTFTRALYDGREIPIYGTSNAARDYVYIDDVVHAIVAALDRQPPLGYEIVNIGSSTPVTVSELIGALAWTTGRKARIRREPERLGDIRFACADVTKANTLLNWHPDITLGDGIRRFVQWFEASRCLQQT